MSESLSRRELEIAETRDRLANTIDRIQGKLTVSGVVDEVLGSAAVPRFEGAYGNALSIVRTNPVPVLILAAGIGWLLTRIGRREREARLLDAEILGLEDYDYPVVSDGRARIYDPDLATDHPASGLRDTTRGAGLNPSV